MSKTEDSEQPGTGMYSPSQWQPERRDCNIRFINLEEDKEQMTAVPVGEDLHSIDKWITTDTLISLEDAR